MLVTGDGRLLATTEDGWLVCYGNAPALAASAWPQFRRNLRRGGTLDSVATVNLVLPDAGMSFRTGQPLPLWADLAQFGPNATNESLVDGQVVATSRVPFRATWTPTVPGVRSVSARAADGLGNSSVSLTVQVTMLPAGPNVVPVVRLESPADSTIDPWRRSLWR